MKRFFFLLNFILLLFFFDSSSQELNVCSLKLLPEIPKVGYNDVVISHVGYSFLYNEQHEQASWVAYELTKEETKSLFKRSNQFKPDPAVSSFTAHNADYARSGYDKGHLAPAADMGWSAKAMAESFYFSNMSPQDPGFNRGIWKKLEELVRSWAIENNSLLIVTGPVLRDSLKTIGADQVSVPEWYYKVILDNHEPGIKGLAFLLPNSSQRADLESFVVSIDSVECVTGINFFPDFPNEEVVEKYSSIEQWTWTSSRIDMLVSNKSTFQGQCLGVTKTGSRCNNKTTHPNGFCHIHVNQFKIQTSKSIR